MVAQPISRKRVRAAVRVELVLAGGIIDDALRWLAF